MTIPYVQMAVFSKNEDGTTGDIQDIIRFPKSSLFLKSGYPSASGRFMFERMIEEAEAGNVVALETGFEDPVEAMMSSVNEHGMHYIDNDKITRVKEVHNGGI
jgi:hypothetical protein